MQLYAEHPVPGAGTARQEDEVSSYTTGQDEDE